MMDQMRVLTRFENHFEHGLPRPCSLWIAGLCMFPDRSVRHRPDAGLETRAAHLCGSRCRGTRNRLEAGVRTRRDTTGAVRFGDRGPKEPPRPPPSRHRKPNHRKSSRIAVKNSVRQRAASRSSLRNISVPPLRSARCWAVQKVRACPRCISPVGDGAKRPRYWIAVFAG